MLAQQCQTAMDAKRIVQAVNRGEDYSAQALRDVCKFIHDRAFIQLHSPEEMYELIVEALTEEEGSREQRQS
jgi:hypothetical protein